MSPRRTKTRAWVLAFYLVASLAYIVWRVLSSRNPDAPVYSWIFWALETYGIVASAAFYLVVRKRDDPTPPPPPTDLDVDVLICTYNEPVALLRQTVRTALAMEQRHETWLLDDGRREEVRALAEELGCRYLTRKQNTHYKAGNLNHALPHTKGDLVLVLDADHLVRKHFLTRVLGFFRDPEVALVQTPQVYYNVDSFQHHFAPAKRKLWHEGAIFHHAMQAGANRWNAAVFVGTGAVLRRSALENVGGFATGSVTEDVFTSMRLHARGYRSVYLDEPLAYLLAPESLHQYLTQRLRWGQGALQILRLQNPLTLRGLSFAQRFVYFNALSSFGHGVLHLAYYLAPPLYLLGGLAPIRADTAADFAPIVAHIVVDLAMFKLMLGSLARPLLAECYKLLNLYVYIRSLGGYFETSGRLSFRVTNKGGDGRVSARLLAPQGLLLSLNLTAFGFGVLRLVGPHDTLQLLGVGVAMSFAALFTVIGTMTVMFAYRRIASRGDGTLCAEIPAALLSPAGRWQSCTAVRVSDTALHLALDDRDAPFAPGDTVDLQLYVGDERSPARLRGLVARGDGGGPGGVVVVEPRDMQTSDVDRLYDRLVTRSIPRLVDPFVHGWKGRPAPEREGAAAVNDPYLPLEPNVL